MHLCRIDIKIRIFHSSSFKQGDSPKKLYEFYHKTTQISIDVNCMVLGHNAKLWGCATAQSLTASC